MDTERQELHCHNCNNYVQFDADLSQDGNLVLVCPVCGHEHCRIVQNGIITDQRWDRRNGSNGNTFTVTYATNINWTQTSTYSTYTSSYSNNASYNTTTPTYSINWNYSSGNSNTSSNLFLYQSWMNTTAT